MSKQASRCCSRIFELARKGSTVEANLTTTATSAVLNVEFRHHLLLQDAALSGQVRTDSIEADGRVTMLFGVALTKWLATHLADWVHVQSGHELTAALVEE